MLPSEMIAAQSLTRSFLLQPFTSAVLLGPFPMSMVRNSRFGAPDLDTSFSRRAPFRRGACQGLGG